MDEELKPCPFCGGRAEIYSINFNLAKGIYYGIGCVTCFIKIYECPTAEEAFDLWNIRVSPWISVKDRLPEEDNYVLWKYESGFVFYEDLTHDMAQDDVDRFLKGNTISGPITHWMEIPPTKEQ